MSKVKSQITMSLDGFVAGPRQSLENPIGEGGMGLHTWAFATRTFREQQGLEGGDTGLDDDHAGRWSRNTGATVMGRNMFGPVREAWTEPAWTGWWGDDPPFHTPVFVLTNHARDPVEMEGGTTFHFVTDGIDVALERAIAAADGRDVSIPGGASTVQQYLRAGLIDELTVHVAPVFLGAGARLFEDLPEALSAFECVELTSSPAVAHFSYARRA